MKDSQMTHDGIHMPSAATFDYDAYQYKWMLKKFKILCEKIYGECANMYVRNMKP